MIDSIKRGGVMTLLQRLLAGWLSLAMPYGLTNDVVNESLPIHTPKMSLRDWFDPSVTTDKLLTEEPFSLPTSTHYTQWVPFEPVSPSTHRFYLALDSVTQGETDRIFRYAIKLVSRHGVENLRFEGLSCEYRAYRPYAFGSVDGTWSKATQPKWQAIARNVRNDYAAALFDVFCRTDSENIEKIKQRFKKGTRF
jgi:hypothetical protein